MRYRLDFPFHEFHNYQMISVDTAEAVNNLPALLTAVEERQEIVIICRDGSPVAELRAMLPEGGIYPDPLQTYPELKVGLHYDPTEGASADEWPSHLR